MWHGITGIDGQVEQDLFELDRIGPDPSRRGVELQHDCDVFTDEAL